MEFEYEVSAADYYDASIFYYRLNRRRLAAGSGSLFIFGGFLIVVGLIEKEKGLSPLLLIALGAILIWFGVVGFFPRLSPRKRFRKCFKELGIEGKKYRAAVDTEGINIVGDDTTWSRRWSDISSKGEDDKLFLFCSKFTMFIFAKRYLTEEQQQELRSFISLH
jgi:hypothetical protein